MVSSSFFPRRRETYPVFECGDRDMGDERGEKAVTQLLSELAVRRETSNIFENEASRRNIVLCFLHNAAQIFGREFGVIQQFWVEGTYGRGEIDTALLDRATGRVIGVTEAKDTGKAKGEDR